MAKQRLDLLLKEIVDPYVQENFYKLKVYLENTLVGGSGGSTGPQGPQGPPGAQGPEGEADIRKTLDCAVGVAVDDWVYQSTTTDNFAITATDNSPTKGVNGIVLSKPTTTTCEVMFLGITTLAVARGEMFLDASGQASNIAPATGYLQRLGISFGDGQVLIRPDWTRIKRI